MQKTRHISLIICLVIMGLVLSGCGKVKQERDDALAEAAAAKTELAKVKTELAEAAQTALETAQTTRAQLEEAGAKLADTQKALDAASKDKAALDNKVADLTAQRDSALKASEQASQNTITMLAKMSDQAKQYDTQIQDLQAKIKELTDKLKSAESVGPVVPNL